MKNQSLISEIVHEYTFFPSGKHRHYLSIVLLTHLLNLILKTNETAEYIRVTPFYKSTHGQHEFDDHMFFVKRLTNAENADAFLQACRTDENGQACLGVIRCYKEHDLQSFQNAIRDYLAYLPTLVNEIYHYLSNQYKIKDADLLLGSICFEFHAK